jgi:hypothetical protein
MNGYASPTTRRLPVTEPTLTDTASSSLLSLADKPLGHVVVVGAGEGEDLPAWIDLGAQRVVLIEGDADRAESLRLSVARRADVGVVLEVVSPDGGPVEWRRYTLPALDGPLGIEGIAIHLPRVHAKSTESRPSVALHRLLDEIVSDASDDRSHVLVMNVAGQEAALLRSLPRCTLTRFDLIIVHGCRVSRDGVVPNCRDAVEGLLQEFYGLHSFDAGATPLWPTAALRLDRTRLTAVELHERLDEVTRLKAEAESARDEAMQQAAQANAGQAEQQQVIAALSTTADTRQMALDAATRELERARAEVAASRSHAASLQQALDLEVSRITASEAARQLVEEGLAARVAEVTALCAALDEARATSRELGDALVERDRECDANLQRAALAEMNLDAALVRACEAERLHEDAAVKLCLMREQLTRAERLANEGIRLVAQRSADLVATRRQCDDSIERARLLHDEFDATQRSLEEAKTRAAEATERIAALEEQLASAALGQDAARAEAERERQTAQLAVRIAALRENDLVELRGRYALLDQRDRERDQLLEALARTLTSMASQLGMDIDSSADSDTGKIAMSDPSDACAGIAAQPALRSGARRRGSRRSTDGVKA